MSDAYEPAPIRELRSAARDAREPGGRARPADRGAGGGEHAVVGRPRCVARLRADSPSYLVFAMMWNLLAGYGGMVSIGQQAFFGIGGYGMLILANYCGVSPFVAVPIAAVIATVVAVPVSLVAFRLEGGYFAIGTWVIAEVFRLTVANVSVLGGGSGTSLTALQDVPRALRESLTLWLALAIVAAAIGLLYLFLRSKAGLALTAMRDNAVAASSQGVDVKRARLVVYLVSACGTALAGGLYFVGNLRISPDAAFSVNWTAFAHFHRDDRRSRHARRADRRRADLLPAEQVPVGLRHLVSDRTRRARDRGDDVLSAGPVGLRVAPLWPATVPGGAAGRVCRRRDSSTQLRRNRRVGRIRVESPSAPHRA